MGSLAHRTHTGLHKLLIGVSAFSLLALVGNLLAFGPDSERAVVRQYCAMVDVWRTDQALGVPEKQRYGHPDFKRIYEQECREWVAKPGNQ